MRTTLALALTATGLATVACGPDQETVAYDFPRLTLSTEMVEFGAVEQDSPAARTVWVTNLGELPMGITAIEASSGDGTDGVFTSAWSADELDCPEGVELEATPEGIAAVLPPDCRLPVEVSFSPASRGTVWGSLIVRTGTEQLPEDSADDPAFYSDPLHAKRIVYLVGDGERGVANVIVEPRHHDYGHLWSEAAETAYVAIRNSGDSPLTVQEPTLQDCDDGFAITALGAPGAYAVLEPGVSTYVEVSYTPADTDPASCELLVETDDPDTPQIEVDLEANTGTDPDNEPPTAIVRSPAPGHQWFGGEEDSLPVQINIFDLNQPADTLTCRVKSMVQAAGAAVAHCDADDASGMVWVDVPYRYVGDGSDTIKIQVSDASGVIGFASTSVLWNSPYPFSDDDGDGWGQEVDADEDGHFDCDDDNAATYPYAAELPDGQDNDCDGVVDEGTAVYDDDGDSFSEAEGDCDDHDAEVFAGNYEQADHKDNDCDGIIDEGTSLYDDDGDGYTEMDRDCDDSDPNVHPGAIEYCDGIDNDCDGVHDYDDGCIELDSTPYVVGGIQLDQTACEPGDDISVSVVAYDADGQDLDYAWTGDEGLVIQPLTGSPTVTVTCPEPASRSGEVLGLYVYITDEDQNAVWAFDDLWVYPAGDLYRQFVEIVFD